MNYHAFTPDTGTCELPSVHRGRPYWEAQTVELSILDLRPSVPVRYQRPNRLRRLLGSPFARHVRSAASSAFLPGMCGAGAILAFSLLAWLQDIAPSVVIR